MQHLHLENNQNFTLEGLHRLRGVPQLRTLKLRMCLHVGRDEATQLIADLPHLEQVNDCAAGSGRSSFELPA